MSLPSLVRIRWYGYPLTQRVGSRAWRTFQGGVEPEPWKSMCLSVSATSPKLNNFKRYVPNIGTQYRRRSVLTGSPPFRSNKHSKARFQRGNERFGCALVALCPPKACATGSPQILKKVCGEFFESSLRTDAGAFQRQAECGARGRNNRRLRDRLAGRHLIVGLDLLDYFTASQPL